MKIILTADVGSTFTKLTAVDMETKKIIGTAKSFTTIETNVMEGYGKAMAELEAQCGKLVFDKKVAASSAAGGLKMIAVGLVPDLTVQAARMATANAGAKIMKTFSYELSRDELDEIVSLAPDMILLSGGTDGGNKDVILHNARLLADSPLTCSIVVAGNKSAKDDLQGILKNFGGEVLFCANVMPELNQLNIEPAKKAIRDLFIKNIISAKGLSELQATLASEIIPTPLAVFEAASLLSKGTKSSPGLGELVVFDVGGATTDVYSMAEGLPTRANVFLHGFRHPFAKRTVEGDLGMRYSLRPLAEAIGVDNIACLLDIDEREVEAWISTCSANPEILPEAKSLAKRIDEAMARAAVKISMERHVGSVEAVFTSTGQSFAQTGKDLSEVRYLIGTGGPIIHAADPDYVLKAAVYEPSDMNLLKPLAPKTLVDKKYILSAMGTLSRIEPETALAIMKEEIPVE
ncbi:DNA mismatch repair protein MutL [Deltaproteobacteria bacterium Smac51]|nr:DNA mismatch repair protein MutL [Deltaproteobacteria bacterium Smac51]